MKLHFLPPYCPDDNRIERLWKDLHDNVTRNHTCRSMTEIMERVHDYVDARRRTGRHRYITAATPAPQNPASSFSITAPRFLRGK